MKKICALLTFFSLTAVHAKPYRCQIILGGLYPDNLILKEPKTELDCIKAGKELFEKNKENYNKLFIVTESEVKEIKVK